MSRLKKSVVRVSAIILSFSVCFGLAGRAEAALSIESPRPYYGATINISPLRRGGSVVARFIATRACVTRQGEARFAAAGLIQQPMPQPGPAGAVSQNVAPLVPQTTPTPRPTQTPWNQLGNSVTPTPSPTADPMIQQSIRENVEKAFVVDIVPTPRKATPDMPLSAAEAADKAVAAAKASFRGLEITKSNIQKQAGSLRDSVNMAIRALDADDRYRELVDADELWGEKLEPEPRMEFEAYKAMGYKELTSDERRELISVRDMGYDRLNFNIKKVDYNMEIVKRQLMYAAYAQYCGIAKMQSAVSIREDALALQKRNLEILKSKFELGVATRAEMENAELSYEKAKVEINVQKRSLKSLVTGFNKLIGENLASTYQDFDRAKLKPYKKDKSADSFRASAMEKRGELLIAREELSLAKRQVQLYDTEITKFSTLDDKQDAIQAADEAQISLELAEQGVESGINNAYKQLVALRGATPYYESQIRSAQDGCDRAQKLFELGMATAVSVDQALVSVSQAKVQLENNLIDIWLKQQKLDIISGIGPGNI